MEAIKEAGAFGEAMVVYGLSASAVRSFCSRLMYLSCFLRVMQSAPLPQLLPIIQDRL